MLLNRISTFISIAKLLPIDIQLLPKYFRILKKGPTSSGWDISMILAPILKKQPPNRIISSTQTELVLCWRYSVSDLPHSTHFLWLELFSVGYGSNCFLTNIHSQTLNICDNEVVNWHLIIRKTRCQYDNRIHIYPTTLPPHANLILTPQPNSSLESELVQILLLLQSSILFVWTRE